MMRRRFAVLGVLSLLPCLGAGGLWIRTLAGTDEFEWTTAWRHGNAITRSKYRLVVGECGERGAVRLYHQKFTSYNVDPVVLQQEWPEFSRRRDFRHSRGPWVELEMYDTISFWNRLGFFASHSNNNYRLVTTSMQMYGAPLWPLLALSALLPGLWLLGLARRIRRRRQGRCPCCGYDLRATPDRCPECGATPPRAASPPPAAP